MAVNWHLQYLSRVYFFLKACLGTLYNPLHHSRSGMARDRAGYNAFEQHAIRATAVARLAAAAGYVKNPDTKPANPNPPESKRIFWIIPNYRTSPSLHRSSHDSQAETHDRY